MREGLPFGKLITAFIGFILVIVFIFPIFAPQQVKNKKDGSNVIPHGAYICYKEFENGKIVLKQARVDVIDNKEFFSENIKTVDVCSFEPPSNAEQFKIILIGAGGVGANSSVDITMGDSSNSESYKVFSLNQPFKDSLMSKKIVMKSGIDDIDLDKNMQEGLENALLNLKIQVQGGAGASSTTTHNITVAPHCDRGICYSTGELGATCTVTFNPKFEDIIEIQSGFGGKIIPNKEISVKGEDGSIKVIRNNTTVLEVIAHGGQGAIYKNLPCRYDANAQGGSACAPLELPQNYDNNLMHSKGAGKCEIRHNTIAAVVEENINRRNSLSTPFSNGENGRKPSVFLQGKSFDTLEFEAKRIAITPYQAGGGQSGNATSKIMHYLTNEGKVLYIPQKFIGESVVGGTAEIPCGEAKSRTTCIKIGNGYFVSQGGKDGVQTKLTTKTTIPNTTIINPEFIYGSISSLSRFVSPSRLFTKEIFEKMPKIEIANCDKNFENCNAKPASMVGTGGQGAAFAYQGYNGENGENQYPAWRLYFNGSIVNKFNNQIINEPVQTKIGTGIGAIGGHGAILIQW